MFHLICSLRCWKVRGHHWKDGLLALRSGQVPAKQPWLRGLRWCDCRVTAVQSCVRTACPVGKYGAESGLTACSLCLKGKYNAQTHRTSEDACLPCDPGTFASS